MDFSLQNIDKFNKTSSCLFNLTVPIFLGRLLIQKIIPISTTLLLEEINNLISEL